MFPGQDTWKTAESVILANTRRDTKTYTNKKTNEFPPLQSL